MVLKKIIDRIKAEYKYAYLAYKTNFLYNKRAAEGQLAIKPCDEFCDLAVVSFNNAKVIDYQIRLLQKYFIYPFRYTVFDNSNEKTKIKEIKEVCERNSIAYIRLPEQEFMLKGFGSYSHGIACNYLYTKFIKDGGSKYFGLLDHDIFPIENFNISNILEKQAFYGHKHRFYLWPGLFFIRMDYVKEKQLDFRPSLHLHGDTGACNWPYLFKDIDWTSYELTCDEKKYFGKDDDILQSGYSHYNCGWIHCTNASNYTGKGNIDDKMNKIYNLLDQKL